MEPAWEKERGLKFQPTQIRIGRQGEDRYENRVSRGQPLDRWQQQISWTHEGDCAHEPYLQGLRAVPSRPASRTFEAFETALHR